MTEVKIKIEDKEYTGIEIIDAITKAARKRFDLNKTYTYQPDNTDNFYTTYSFQEKDPEPKEKVMTVQDLIDSLEHYDKDTPVVMADYIPVGLVVESVNQGCVIITDETE
jgi:hypothetical protein